MKIEKIIIGSRGSKLALIYAEKVKDALKNVFNGNIEIKKISTTGDQNQNERLSEIGGKGLFSKNIELQLIEKNIDIAVHALKDMPSFETKGLYTGCFLKRNYSNEILISKNNIKFDKLKPKSIVGTSSLRREYQLKRKRDDRYKEVSKDRLFQIAKKKIQTTMIGALDSIEKSFGFLWQTDGELTQEQVQLKSIFENARSEILDRGNTQIRNLEAEFSHYDVSWKRYTVSLPIKEEKKEN